MDNAQAGDARLALNAIELQQRHVIAEIDMPWWYWWGVGLGWVALGVVADWGNAWGIGVGTLFFGAVHSAVAQRVLSGRHRSSQLSVRADMVNRHVPALVIGYLVVLAGFTVGISLLLRVDGAGHPTTIASCFILLAVVWGGPNLMAAVRHRAERHLGA
jgi:hypothetical protein